MPDAKGQVIGTFTIGPDDLPIRPRSMAPLPPAAGPKASNFRLVLGCGFFASLILGIFSLLESNIGLTILAGLAALLCLFLLFLPGGQTPRD